MATWGGKKGQRGGHYRKQETWSGSRDYNKSGSSSPGPRRSNSPSWRFRQDYHKDSHKEYRENQHRTYANYLHNEWRKVEQDLTKDQRLTGTVEYVAKTPTDIKDEDLCNVELHLKNREEIAESPD